VQLCELPFPYFSDTSLQPLLFGTLLSACYGSDRNRDVVERELSADMLLGFLQSSAAEIPEEVLEANAKAGEAKTETGGGREGKAELSRELSDAKSKTGNLSGEESVAELLEKARSKMGEATRELVDVLNGRQQGGKGSVVGEPVEGASEASMASGGPIPVGTTELVGSDEAELESGDVDETGKAAAVDEEATAEVHSPAKLRTENLRLLDGASKAGAPEQGKALQGEVSGPEANAESVVKKQVESRVESGPSLSVSKRENGSRPRSARAKVTRVGAGKRQEGKLAGAKGAGSAEVKKAGQELAAPFRLQNRFPVSLWTAAEEYFAKPPGKH
jgi:hypothetical protein